MNNPLFDPSLPLPFDQIEPQHIEPAITAHLKAARQALDALADSATVNYANSFLALENATEKLETAMGMVEHLESPRCSVDRTAIRVGAQCSSVDSRASRDPRIRAA